MLTKSEHDDDMTRSKSDASIALNRLLRVASSLNAAMQVDAATGLDGYIRSAAEEVEKVNRELGRVRERMAAYL